MLTNPMLPMFFAAFFQTALFVICLFLAAGEDLKSRKIPNRIIFALIFGWLIYTPELSAVLLKRSLSALAIALFVFLLSLAYQTLCRRKGIGGGDIKLILASVLYLGFTKGLYMILIACVLAGIFSLVLRRNRGRIFPFGPYLCAGALLVFFLP